MHRPELLAPAGRYECVSAAFNAGADAVYLAGKEFGARASAQNFTQEELLTTLDIAHLNNKKVYLTLNTLIKQREWDQLEGFLRPLYENALDGVIIQDMGLISYLKENFPKLSIHASTQMSVTGSRAAAFLKDMGVSRIVPAREISLDEIIDIKQSTDIEIEAFIHGAMCYCYSGQCLFSSFLGGRSGNRGRCAQPCRLSYTISENGKYINKENVRYPLSLKDMCTVECIDKLIDAGIDSFKIEGRMKSPQYVAGVTSIYRKYIDRYLEDGRLDVKKEDLEFLSRLYIRNDISNGYYFRHNSADMITALDPSYNEADQKLNEQISAQYVKPVKKLKVMGVVTLIPGQKASIILKYKDSVTQTEGDIVDKALNRPLSEDDVIKQLNKTGESYFEFERVEVQMEPDCFMPVKALNELRRKAFWELKENLTGGYKI
ncbi:MAG: U32 family peptidase [Lachnospiraceae bacterium]|nr:U32 family peptidase [Lachnospiraceae bacterium]